MTTSVADDFAHERRARSTALTLAASMATAGAVSPIAVGLGGLVGSSLLGEDQSLATLPVTMFILGNALSSAPAALLMARVGRRAGFLLGISVAVAGGLLAILAISIGSFLAFCGAQTLAGMSSAFVQQYRFAAADASPDIFKARAISWVLAGGVVTGVIGPQAIIFGENLLPFDFAGTYAIQIVLVLIAASILATLSIPKPARRQHGDAKGRPLLKIIGSPRFIVAFICTVSSYALMSLVMTATPLAMLHHHHSHGDAALGIQWHVIAMFAPSFFTGSLIARYGKEAVVAYGLVLIAFGAVIALLGVTVMHFWLSLILLGIGWNFGFIGGTAMIADTYAPEEAARVQAVNEFMLFSIVALASFSSGKLLVLSGWSMINILVFPVVGLSLGLLALNALLRTRNV
ncbi:multidrug resistance protein [Hartmannibacter diazotrophicus]|uniref:Multidrug resistance protein n=1 Tax=Hartmannibacter diazotrophicus TaxID=1482074 RepID=A0A2C9D7I8_9HYPH|nr:MFS transporter [Hartmannibacter diazotrophicus]SON56129.1 multidrug resistance protein [Hartmannibacter diazotrophicus]